VTINEAHPSHAFDAHVGAYRLTPPPTLDLTNAEGNTTDSHPQRSEGFIEDFRPTRVSMCSARRIGLWNVWGVSSSEGQHIVIRWSLSLEMKMTLLQAVEVLLFSPSGIFPDVDALKTGIALKSNGPSHFFIANSGAPQSVSRIICYRDGTIPEMKGMKTCDVHITYFHNAPLGLLRDIDGLPVAPLPFLLLRRLQKWDASLSFTKAGKIRAGVRDIQDLLGMLEKHQFEGTHFDPKLFELSKDCVREYRTVFSEHGNVWKKLGYDDVPPLVSVPSPEAAVSSQVEPNEPIETTEYLDYKSLSRIQMVCLAGKKSVDVLKKLDCASAIFGSLACFLYGNCRSPNVRAFICLSTLFLTDMPLGCGYSGSSSTSSRCFDGRPQIGDRGIGASSFLSHPRPRPSGDISPTLLSAHRRTWWINPSNLV
jgi:hypothetical protein